MKGLEATLSWRVDKTWKAKFGKLPTDTKSTIVYQGHVSRKERKKERTGLRRPVKFDLTEQVKSWSCEISHNYRSLSCEVQYGIYFWISFLCMHFRIFICTARDFWFVNCCPYQRSCFGSGGDHVIKATKCIFKSLFLSGEKQWLCTKVQFPMLLYICNCGDTWSLSSEFSLFVESVIVRALVVKC